MTDTRTFKSRIEEIARGPLQEYRGLAMSVLAMEAVQVGEMTFREATEFLESFDASEQEADQ